MYRGTRTFKNQYLAHVNIDQWAVREVNLYSTLYKQYVVDSATTWRALRGTPASRSEAAAAGMGMPGSRSSTVAGSRRRALRGLALVRDSRLQYRRVHFN